MLLFRGVSHWLASDTWTTSCYFVLRFVQIRQPDVACSLVNLRDAALCSTASRVCTVLTPYRTYILVSRGSTCIKQGCKVLHLPLNKKEEQKVFCLGFLAPICKFPQSQFLCPFFLFSSETLPAAVGGTTLSPGAVTVLQDTRGETDSVLTSSNRPVVCVADLL